MCHLETSAVISPLQMSGHGVTSIVICRRNAGRERQLEIRFFLFAITPEGSDHMNRPSSYDITSMKLETSCTNII